MKPLIALACLVGLLLGNRGALAQQAVTLKVKEFGKGEVYLGTKNDARTTRLSIVDQNKTANELLKSKMIETAEFKETILELKQKQPSKLERVYTKAQSKLDGKTEVSPLQGKTIIIELTGDKAIFTFKDGKEVKGAAATTLAKEFDGKSHAEVLDFLLPKNAVKPGDRWQLGDEKWSIDLARHRDLVVDSSKAEGAGELLKLYKKEGKQFGVMKYKFEVPILSFGKGKALLKFAAGTKLIRELTWEVCIDGSMRSSTTQEKVSIAGTVSVPEMPGTTLAVQIVADFVTVQKELPRK